MSQQPEQAQQPEQPEHSYLTLSGAQMNERRVSRVHTLELRRWDLRLQAEETGGYDAEMADEARELERRIGHHAHVLWGSPDGPVFEDEHDGHGDGGEHRLDDENADGLDAHRHALAHADGPAPSHVDPHAEMPPALGHEEDDLPGAALDAEDTVPCDPGVGTGTALGHVESDQDVLDDIDGELERLGRVGEPDPDDEPHGERYEASAADPGRHAVTYERGRGAFDRVGAFDA